MSGILAPHHLNEDAAREHLESIRWPNGPVCPHCGQTGKAYQLNGKTTRKGLWKCAKCRKPFTVTVNTIFSDSKIPLHKWLLAIHLLASSKKGMSAHQLWRNLWGDNEKGQTKGSYRSAWFMLHRIRWAMGQEPVASKLKGVFEIDDVWIGGRQRVGSKTPEGENPRHGKDVNDNKTPVTTILQREGNVRSYCKITAAELRPVLDQMIDKAEAHIMTDSANKLRFSNYGWKHSAVNHKIKEYARHEDGLTITTNTLESYFAIIQRGVHGVYHQIGKDFIDQYLREFDFRYNARRMSDSQRTLLAIQQTGGKRLMLREPRGVAQCSDEPTRRHSDNPSRGGRVSGEPSQSEADCGYATPGSASDRTEEA
jgi:transposase-like protein